MSDEFRVHFTFKWPRPLGAENAHEMVMNQEMEWTRWLGVQGKSLPSLVIEYLPEKQTMLTLDPNYRGDPSLQGVIVNVSPRHAGRVTFVDVIWEDGTQRGEFLVGLYPSARSISPKFGRRLEKTDFSKPQESQIDLDKMHF